MCLPSGWREIWAISTSPLNWIGCRGKKGWRRKRRCVWGECGGGSMLGRRGRGHGKVCALCVCVCVCSVCVCMCVCVYVCVCSVCVCVMCCVACACACVCGRGSIKLCLCSSLKHNDVTWLYQTTSCTSSEVTCVTK